MPNRLTVLRFFSPIAGSTQDSRWPGRALRALLTLVCLAASQNACDRPTCLGLNAASNDRNAPELLHMELVEQKAQSPWMLLVAVDFSDADGDLADGNMQVYVGASGPVLLPLKEAFLTSELDPHATSGRFALPLFIGQGAVPGDTVLRLGFQLQDERGHYSACYAMDLYYTVSLPSAAQSMGPTTMTAMRTERVACP